MKFDLHSHRILETLITTMCADDPQVLSHINMKRVILRTERFILSLPWFYTFLAYLALYFVEYAIPPFAWKLRPFSKLPFQERLRYLETWGESRFYFRRIIFKMLTSLCAPHIYSETALLERLGYGDSLRHRKEAAASKSQETLTHGS